MIAEDGRFFSLDRYWIKSNIQHSFDKLYVLTINFFFFVQISSFPSLNNLSLYCCFQETEKKVSILFVLKNIVKKSIVIEYSLFIHNTNICAYLWKILESAIFGNKSIKIKKKERRTYSYHSLFYHIEIFDRRVISLRIRKRRTRCLILNLVNGMAPYHFSLNLSRAGI